jgi:hypothetical protein
MSVMATEALADLLAFHRGSGSDSKQGEAMTMSTEFSPMTSGMNVRRSSARNRAYSNVVITGHAVIGTSVIDVLVKGLLATTI